RLGSRRGRRQAMDGPVFLLFSTGPEEAAPPGLLRGGGLPHRSDGAWSRSPRAPFRVESHPMVASSATVANDSGARAPPMQPGPSAGPRASGAIAREGRLKAPEGARPARVRASPPDKTCGE